MNCSAGTRSASRLAWMIAAVVWLMAAVATTASASSASLCSSMADVKSGAGHNCAVWSDGTARCWGGNVNSQLGNGANTASTALVVVQGLSGLSVGSIAAGNSHTCVVSSDGSACCWGLNNDGQLGTGNTTSSNVPVVVSGLSGVRGIATHVQSSTTAAHAAGAKVMRDSWVMTPLSTAIYQWWCRA